MPNQAPNTFAPVLKVLREFAHLGRDEFNNEFVIFCDAIKRPVGNRTVQAWSEDGTQASSFERHERGGEPHWPHHNNRLNLVEFFRKRLHCPEFNDDLLNLDPDTLRIRLQEMLEDRCGIVPGRLPFSSDVFDPGEFKDLCGTYVLYRHALVKSRPMINSDVVTVKQEDCTDSLAIVMYCLPAVEAAKGQPSTFEKHEQFVGRLWKFNQLYFAMTMYNDVDEYRVRRVHTLQFPVLETRAPMHYGIIGGYSANLREPFSARVILMKVSDSIDAEHERTKSVRPYELNDAKVSSIVPLLDNKVGEGHFVLTVDCRKVWTVSPPS